MKLSDQQKEANKIARKKAKELAQEKERIHSEKNQKPVKEITFNIEWKKSAMWGHNPNLECVIHFKDGSSERSPIYKASGCGYDKESTVIASAFNQYLKYVLHKKKITKAKCNNGGTSSDMIKNPIPYGIHCYSDNRPSFGGGIGTNCYYAIGKFIGGKFEKISSGKTFDVYKLTMK